MNAITCELCGSNDVVKQGDYFVCQHCGTKYSLEDAKKLLGTVKIDKTDELEKNFKNARRARTTFDWTLAEKYYDLIVQEEPENAEALFYSAYSTLRVALRSLVWSDENSKTKIETATTALLTRLSALVDYYDFDNEPESRRLVEDAARDVIKIKLFHDDGDFVFQQKEGPESRYVENNVNLLLRHRLKTTIDTLIEIYKKNNLDYAYLTEIEEQISQREKKQEELKKGCYVATAVYGSYDCPQVWTLRRYRDYTLAETWFGRLFILLYYAISPTLVKWFGETQWFKNMWKPRLDRMVKRLNDEGVADTPYQDRNW